MISALRINRAEARDSLDEFQKAEERARRGRRSGRPPVIRGHNPVRYAPFDFQWDALNAGGIGASHLYGTNANTGNVGADLRAIVGYGASAASAVGFWYY